MATLPTPGADTDTWGDELNEWLLVGHDAAGNNLGGGLELIANSLLGADAASIDISGIPGTHVHLLIVGNIRAATAGVSQIDGRIRFNNDSGSNYDWVRWLMTDASGPFTGGGFGETSAYFGLLPAATATAGKASNVSAWITDYAATTFHKSFRTEIGWAQGQATTTVALGMNTGYWRNTAAITQITVFASSGNLLAGSRLSLYGLN